MTVLDRLDALRTEATPGPWIEDAGYRVRDAAGVVITEGKHMTGWNGRDSALIVAAVNALPALLRIARAAEVALAALVEEIDWYPNNEAPEATVKATAELRSALSDLEAQHE